MAYSVLLASVSDDQVVEFREEKRTYLVADSSTRCSHALTAWVKLTELRDSLRLAIDGGQSLRPDLWHPLRSPVWHSPAAVARIESQLGRIWDDLLANHSPADPKDWYVIEISKVLELLRHASSSHNSVVSFLEPPTDRERAEKVSIPITDKPQSSP
jgi:hypothetical protein